MIGYTLHAIYEVLYYSKARKIFHDIYSILTSMKLRNMGFEGSSQELVEHCRRINSAMNYDLNDVDICLDMNNVSMEKNSSLVYFYKLLANSILGKFAQNNDKSSTHFLNSYSQLQNLQFDSTKILGEFVLIDNWVSKNIKNYSTIIYH